MSNEFVHSVTVPRIYKITADIVRRVREDGASLKTLIYEKKHPNVAGIYGLAVNTLQALPQLDQLFDKTQILTEQPRLNPWLARVLITELLWRKRCLKNRSKPVLTVLAYENKLREESINLGYIETFVDHKDKVKRPRYVRVNTLLLSVEKAISLFQEDGWQLLPKSTTYSSYLQSLSQLSEPYFIQDLHIPEMLAFPPSTIFHNHEGYRGGKLILQDKASSLPVHLLNPISGSTVLDMCAAPGMKATHVAAKLQNNGTIYAVEIDAKRFKTLLTQLEKTHALCVEPLNQDVLTLNSKLYSHVEYILVDPTCSGSGIVDRPKQSEMDGMPELKRLKNLQSFQVYLLRYALFNFPNAKRIIYSTCSLHPEENEEVVDEVLANVGNAYRLLPVRQLLKNNWTNFSSKKYNCGDLCLYSKPNDDFCNGFFVAVFERNFDVTLPKCKLKGGNEYNMNLTETNLNIKKDDMAKTFAHQQEKCEKKKKKKKKKKEEKEVISISDEQMKISADIVEFEVLDIDSKIKAKSKNEVEKMDICNDSFNFNKALNGSKDIQKETLDIMETKKSKKKKSKHENTFLEIDYDEKEQNKEIGVELLKIKKKKENKEIKNDKIHKIEQAEETVIGSSKKRKKSKEIY
ncbi:PREDICTED: probable 28S rRNA (cytosine-C(5))-methyltransferase [Acromyrmex echinatior]|uniref:Putative methyltransferase NSUN5 n=1 Tax=Acromyrmex echinatior TaxID=103372 RepID=F4WT35_ACREC|nr:PREDICTED: probable 28S rRNA (cytosine-C(5))-methyltransferase [Acromyrmex echinatior]EGI62648.1 Putative methyltransferase NSUN5 [Acromyrmex echinatior]